MERNFKYLSLCKSEAAWLLILGFNQGAASFFSLLEEVLDANKLHVENIWNYEKTGISSVLKCLSKIVSTKGKRQVGSLTSADRRQLVTAVICSLASGRFMPPIMILTHKRMKPELTDGTHHQVPGLNVTQAGRYKKNCLLFG